MSNKNLFTDEIENCWNCHFMMKKHCHYNPPKVFNIPEHGMYPEENFSLWPPVDIKDWCGKWEQRHNIDLDD